MPARLASKRVPHKALAPIAGLPLLEHVRRRAIEAGVGPVIVATDDDRIAEVVAGFGGAVVRTGDHPNGTLRVAEAARSVDAAYVLNVQADQPLLDPHAVRVLAELVVERDCISTLCCPFPVGREVDRARVKVWVDERGFARDFARDWKADEGRLHLGLYAFPRDQLSRVTSLPIGERARAERLEQLTWLDAGFPIAVGEVEGAVTAVDTPEQLAAVRTLLGG